MQEIKYYPLIDCDSIGAEKTPMFFSDDEDTVRQSHEMYLQEIVPQYYRLCSVGGLSAASSKTYIIHCPLCGKGMTPISAPVDKYHLALYCCRNCHK